MSVTQDRLCHGWKRLLMLRGTAVRPGSRAFVDLCFSLRPLSLLGQGAIGEKVSAGLLSPLALMVTRHVEVKVCDRRDYEKEHGCQTYKVRPDLQDRGTQTGLGSGRGKGKERTISGRTVCLQLCVGGAVHMETVVVAVTVVLTIWLAGTEEVPMDVCGLVTVDAWSDAVVLVNGSEPSTVVIGARFCSVVVVCVEEPRGTPGLSNELEVDPVVVVVAAEDSEGAPGPSNELLDPAVVVG